jgi:hypothetical protein
LQTRRFNISLTQPTNNAIFGCFDDSENNAKAQHGMATRDPLPDMQ